MKTYLIPRFLKLVLPIVILMGLFAPQQAESKNYSGVSFQIFYDELSPYGDWVKDARYGYIWLPAVRQDFHPYGTEGHWVMSEFGNTWVSYYDWGWAPFHYGRWYFDDYFQSWAWIPGYDWGPAWVNWRTGGGYYGWAPLGPGVSINVRVNLPSFHWVFLPRHRVYHHYAYRYYAPHHTRVKIYNNTTVINNTYVYNNQTYVTGPSRRELQQVTRSKVPVYQVRNSEAPGRASISRNSLNVYRPEIQPSRNASVNSRPSRVLEANQAKSSRSNRTINESAPSRNSSTGSSAPSRTLESSGRSGQNSDVSTGRTAPSRSSSPSVNEGSQKPKVTPMQNESRNRSTGPAQVERPETRQSVPSRSTETRPSTSPSTRSSAPASRPSGEVKRTESRTSTPSRGTVQQSRPSQAPARTQAPQVKRTEPAKSQPSRSSGSRSSSVEVKKSDAGKNSSTQSRTANPPSRSSGRNN